MKKNKLKQPRKNSIVKFDFESLPKRFHKKYPFRPGHSYVFFGEIPNMPGHCIVADYKTGKIYSGYHVENFIELNSDET